MARPYALSAPGQDRAVALWRDGWSALAIARALGVQRPTVVGTLGRAGVTVTNRWHANHGAEHHLWRGGRVRVHGGYIGAHVSSDSPYAVMGRRRDSNVAVYVPEHRLVMAQSLGRPLVAYETVHHINGIKDDNRVENLQLRSGNHGKGVVHVCLDCGSTNVGSQPLTEASTGRLT